MLKLSSRHPQVVVMARHCSSSWSVLPYRRETREHGYSAYFTLGRIRAAWLAIRYAWECRQAGRSSRPTHRSIIWTTSCELSSPDKMIDAPQTGAVATLQLRRIGRYMEFKFVASSVKADVARNHAGFFGAPLIFSHSARCDIGSVSIEHPSGSSASLIALAMAAGAPR